ncbi:MAG TPA: SH3 domain-containing protein [Candidatus Saccharimonadia bacterium]|nr:SH3 domain-containing protein [Candidatus Saccharimonadia bacterium]
MEAKDLHASPQPAANLMDKIAADPDIINRGAAVPAPVVTSSTPAPEVARGAGGQADLMSAGSKAPVFNWLDPQPLAPPVAAAASIPVGGMPGAGAAVPAKPRSRRLWLLLAVLAIVVAAGGVTAYAVLVRPMAEPVAQATPTPHVPTPTPTPSVAPTATPTPTPTAPATPSPTPPPVNVTAPVVAPTVEHPQAVKVTSKNGLWLRSSPDSSNQSNVIGWMPNGATVSVDATGSFWWHGTYGGKTGYFAVSYTK